MARGKKRIKSLLELMDPEGDYGSLGKKAPEPAEEPEGKTTGEQGSVEEPAEETEGEHGPVEEPAKETESEQKGEKSPVERPAAKKEPSEDPEQDYATEPLMVVGDGKIRLVVNYPLAVLVCFVALVFVICAVLVGWRFGRDQAARDYVEGPRSAGPAAEQRLDGLELE